MNDAEMLASRVATFIRTIESATIKPRWKGDRIPVLSVEQTPFPTGVRVAVRADGLMYETIAITARGALPVSSAGSYDKRVSAVVTRAYRAAKANPQSSA